MGDFTDLASLARGAGAARGAALGLNPLHALFAAEPRHVSPYSPSSRILLDYLYIDVDGGSRFRGGPGDRGAGTRRRDRRGARNASWSITRRSPALKRPVFEALFRRFRRARSTRRAIGAAFREFQRAGGAALADFATFEALHEHRCGNGPAFSMARLAGTDARPASAEVAEFADEHRDRVEFFQFLQWEADRQLGEAARRGREAGLSIGLYRDLAVGVDPQWRGGLGRPGAGRARRRRSARRPTR